MYPAGDDPSLAFSIAPDGKEFQRISEKELNSYLEEGPKEMNILKNLGLETINVKLSPLKDYLIFVNAKDKKLYSLKI